MDRNEMEVATDESPMSDSFDIGVHRPVYLWGGPGTVRMNRLKFMGAPVDEAVHAEAHTPEGARRMAEEAAFSWAYLMYNWGFPPEIEREDWAAFRRAVEEYQRAGIRVFGYVQFSNCVYDGSFRDRDWYALDPKGHPFYYYTGRYMTCWTHPGWLDHLRGIVRGIVEAGADGVFFDNPWHGIQPLNLGGVWMGPAGCSCTRCRVAFRQATGREIPVQIAPESDEGSRRYLRWRAEQVTGTMAMLADYARSLNPEVVISANDFDAVMRPSTLIYGIDLKALAGVQDVIMIEDYGLPRWEDGEDSRAPVLVNNALTLRTARALIGDTPLSTDPYDLGIGFDGMYPPRRFRQGIAEAAACGATMVVKGTEYVEGGEFTLLTAERFGPQRAAIGDVHHWLAGQASLYQGRENAARVGLLHPGDALWQAWGQLAPLYFGAGQTLLAAGIPWRVATGEEQLAGLDLLLCFGPAPDEDALPPGLRVVSLPELPGWAPRPLPVLARHRGLRSMVSRFVGWLFQSYFHWRWWRQLVDRSGLQHFFWQSPFFRLPPVPAQEALLEALGERPYPRVRSGVPVLVEAWRKGEGWQLHLVNYGGEPQPVTVEFGQPVGGTILSPDGPAGEVFEGRSVEIGLSVYTVLDYKECEE
ncbi:MAG: hypothetical protein P8189_08740 [Anaerolineae bacterium]